MRRVDREITDKKEIESILERGFALHLGLVDGIRPYVVPLNYAYCDGIIYVHCASQGKKLDLLNANNNVYFEVDITKSKIEMEGDQPCDWGTAFESVMGFGTAEILEDVNEKINGLNAIVGRYSPGKFKFPESEVKATTVIKIKIEEMTGKKAHC